jgi:hypothetical protein
MNMKMGEACVHGFLSISALPFAVMRRHRLRLRAWRIGYTACARALDDSLPDGENQSR